MDMSAENYVHFQEDVPVRNATPARVTGLRRCASAHSFVVRIGVGCGN